MIVESLGDAGEQLLAAVAFFARFRVNRFLQCSSRR